MITATTNMWALNAHRHVKNTGASNRQASNRLASGYRINSAADDAAGLAISETMRAQIRGLMQASDNIKDGVNLANTMDGGMQEISNMMIRKRELIIQGLNDTNTELNRTMIRLEIEQLATEIDAITDRVEFNTLRLLNGGVNLNVGSNLLETLAANPGLNPLNQGSTHLSLWSTSASNTVSPINFPPLSVSVATTQGNLVYWELFGASPAPPSGPVDDGEGGVIFTNSTVQINVGFPPGHPLYWIGGSSNAAWVSFSQSIRIRPHESGIGEVFEVTYTIGNSPVVAGGPFAIGLATVQGITFSQMGQSASFSSNLGNGWNFALISGQSFTFTFNPGAKSDLWIQSGANPNQGMYLNLHDLRPFALGVDNITISEESLQAIDEAMEMINGFRAITGAQQNRLGHAWRAADISAENLSDAESRVRDADMAREMMRFTTSNILKQAGVSMLAQANQQHSHLLTLLR